MNKKILVIICCFFSILMMQSCDRETSESKTTPLTFSMLFNETKLDPLNKDWLILSEYSKRKNVVFDIQVADDANFENAIDLALRTTNPPDIILKVWPQNIIEFANDGYLLPISDYYDQMPYFKAYIESQNLENELEKLKMENDKYYILPGFQRKIQVQQWIYRKDIFDENSLEAPETYDELIDSLVYLKQKYPSTIPISATWGGAHLFSMIGAGYNIVAGWSGTKYFNVETNRWEFAPATDNYKEMYKFLNRCYQAGILDPDYLTQNEKEFYTKIQDGRVLLTVSWITSGFKNWNDQLKKNGYSNGKWAPFSVPESTIGISALPAVTAFKKGIALSSSVKDKPYFKDLLNFIDWALYSNEGQTLTYWGVEGITYEDTNDGKVYLPTISTFKNPEGTIKPKSEFGLDTFFNIVENQELEDYKRPPEIVEFLQQSLNNNDTAPEPPVLVLNEESLKAINLLSPKIDQYVTETSNKFITGELDIDDYWQEYINELTKYGYKTLENIYNSLDENNML